MCIVVDAGIIKNHFDNKFKGNNELTYDPSEIFEMAGEQYVIFLDGGGHIEKEWGEPVDDEWFSGFISDLFIRDALARIDVDSISDIRGQLIDIGFPVDDKDVWYLKTSRTLSNDGNRLDLVTEDIDFYESKKKDELFGDDRLKYMIQGKGDMFYLFKNDMDVNVSPVALFLGVEQIYKEYL